MNLYLRSLSLITEETYPHPITAYGAAKLAACVLTNASFSRIYTRNSFG